MATANLFLEQRTDEWRQARCGKVTASEIANVLSKPRESRDDKKKGKAETAGRMNYRAQIIAEVLTKKPADDPINTRPMQWGIEQERFARAAYELYRGFLVDTVGFVDHPTIENFGCSPDGLVGEEGMVQFKCPNTATHIEYLLKGEVPAEHQPQMIAELACCRDREWIDFVSFDPRLPADLQLFVRRLHRVDVEDRIASTEVAVADFLAEVRDYLVRLACLNPDGMEDLLKRSLDLAEKKRGPQAVVRVMDRKATDEVAEVN